MIYILNNAALHCNLHHVFSFLHIEIFFKVPFFKFIIQAIYKQYPTGNIF